MEKKGNGAVIGGWVCLALGTAAMCWTLWSFLLYAGLFVAAFVLAVVALAQRRLVNGILILVLSIILPVAGTLLLSSYHAYQAFSDNKAAQPLVAVAASSTASIDAKPSTAIPTPQQQAELDAVSYVSKVQLYDINARYFDAVLDGRVPGIEFKLKNTGDRTVTEVDVTVYFKDKDGNTIAEQTYYPVLKNEYSSSPYTPLKPGYIWQPERGRFMSAKSVPSEWKAGSVEAKVTAVKLEPQ